MHGQVVRGRLNLSQKQAAIVMTQLNECFVP
jgi:hypothetical protein